MSELSGLALKSTIRAMRADHPGMWGWLDSTDTAHREVIARWRSSAEVSAYLASVHGRRHHKALRNLLSAARAFLEAQDGEVRQRWHEVQPVLGTAPYSVRCVLWVVFGKALEEGKRGGPNVLMSYITVHDLVRAQFGIELDLSSVRYARDWAVSRGVLTVTPGQKRQAGHQQRATIWHLCNKPLPGGGPIAQGGVVLALRGGAAAAGHVILPPLGYSADLREVMERSFARQRIAREEHWEAGWWRRKPAQSPDYAWVASLIAA